MVTLIRLADSATYQHHRQVVERLRFAGLPVREHGPHLLSVTVQVAGDAREPADVLANHPQVAEVTHLSVDHPQVASEAVPEHNSTVTVGTTVIGANGFVVIAGPCAVESRDQMLTTCHAVSDAGAHILRGGLYKPRTSPYGFQGMGQSGFSLADEARAETGLPLITEIVDVRDIDDLGDHVDMVQVGARNMQNFALLRELGRSRIPVLLKRGLAATIDEVLLAAEYLLDGGNDQVVLCERGIRTYERAYRFTLDITAVPVLQERTHLPVIVDPSHAAGATRWVEPLALAAAAVGADGILVETHCDPAAALCDGKQALRTEALPGLIERLAVATSAAGRTMLPQPERMSATQVAAAAG